jgi:hypothetical protein
MSGGKTVDVQSTGQRDECQEDRECIDAQRKWRLDKVTSCPDPNPRQGRGRANEAGFQDLSNEKGQAEKQRSSNGSAGDPVLDSAGKAFSPKTVQQDANGEGAQE